MPAQYEAIKKSLSKQHPSWSTRAIKTLSARIYNSTKLGKKNPVHRGYETLKGGK